MAFNLADMVNKRPKQVQQVNTSDTVYRDVFKLVRRRKFLRDQTRTGSRD